MRRTGLSVVAMVLSLALSGLLSHPANAAIHELTAKFCSGDHGNLDPGGQEAFGKQSFLRALQATGIYDIHFGEAPTGGTSLPLVPASPTTVTVLRDLTQPASKFAPAAGFVSFTEGGFTIYLSNGIPDSPAFAHCPNVSFGAP